MTMINRIYIKARAKQAIFVSKPSPLFAGMILTAVYFLIYIFQYTGDAGAYAELISTGTYTATDLLKAMWSDMTSNQLMMALQICFYLFNSYISFGMVCYSTKVASGSLNTSVQEMFPPILLFLKYLLISIVTAVIVSIGFICFIIPGFILSICYSQAKYIMLEHPEFSFIKCMTESRKLMKGRLMEYFVLALSFIGWNFLTSFSIITGIWTYPYTNITMAIYYRQISGESVVFDNQDDNVGM